MSARRQAGFTLLECMIALLLVATSLVIVIEAQSWAVDVSARTGRMNIATMLARDLMTDLELRMEAEGFGEIEIKERGDFNDDHFANAFDEYRWEYEVEKVDLDELPNLGMLLGLAEDGTEEAGQSMGVATGQGAGPGGELAMLEGLGIDLGFFGEMMGQYLREARVRVCYPDGYTEDGDVTENCVEISSHLTNPTGRVTAADEMEDDDDAPVPPGGPPQPPPRGR
jgi:prepilin-type N-terminal cleavage/methylation domain-containing protein